MILIISNKSDIHCNPVINHLNKSNLSFFRLNTENILNDYSFDYIANNNDEFLIIKNLKNNKIFNSKFLTSVWERRPKYPNFTKYTNSEINSVIKDEVNEFIKWIRYYVSTKNNIGNCILDRPNECKIQQIRVATKLIKDNKLKIKIPITLITNNKEKISNTFQNYNSLIIKPIGADGIQIDDKFEMPFFARKIELVDLLKINSKDFNICPVFVQNYIDKLYELRVTVVGKESFCCKIHSQSLPTGKGKEDWREGYSIGLPQEWINTPSIIHSFCLNYLKNVSLNFGCFDFIYSKNKNYYFLECNPNGQWMWMENDIGIPISKSIADFLSYNDK